MESPARSHSANRFFAGRDRFGWHMGLVQTRTAHFVGLIFVVAILLRVALAFVNTEANDDHVEIIQIIVDEHRLPTREEAWEGFQPKFYHLTVAALARVLGFQSRAELTQLGQVVACFAGIATLFVVWWFLRSVNVSANVRALSFALVALNPTLIGINAQATNDSFVILFTTLALFSGCRFFQEPSVKAFVQMTLAAILAAISKGNGLVVIAAIAVTCGIVMVFPGRKPIVSRQRLAPVIVLFAVVVLGTVPWIGPYWDHYREYGSAFVTNMERSTPPQFLTITYDKNPGVVSIVQSYLTFRFVDLLKNPMLTYSNERFPWHRTSVWTQLYGRANFVHFQAVPPSWENRSELVQSVGRLIFVLALLPSTMLLLGIVRASRAALLSAAGRPIAPAVLQPTLESSVLLLAAGLGFVAFLVLYTWSYRDFTTMKAIFVFPAVLAYGSLLAVGMQYLSDQFGRLQVARWIGGAALLLLLLAYLTDTLLLVRQLV